ncbi:hypothetical protein jhhlp_007490 [Lomentospora prolificans]|uniref:Uncharacterized protein n=1 Tax=Lomentospora prolificans TaxID=41688 RepID=A0A2N3N168_9PEZI|nr:hypothetical protein jhhlp_007490 [Lomentospora prolificans]
MAHTIISSSRPRAHDRFKTTPPEPYSDASSTYWPPGWNWARYSAMKDEDFNSLSEEESSKMREGFRSVLGEEEFGRMASYVWNKSQKRERQAERERAAAEGRPIPARDFHPPDWLQRWKRKHEGNTWGFVGFRTALYPETGDTDAVQKAQCDWDEFKCRVDAILNVPFESVIDHYDGFVPSDMVEARDKFEIRWVEDSALVGADADTLRERFQKITKNLEPGIQNQLFLCASPTAVESVLQLHDDKFPTVESRLWREGAPYLLAVTTYSGRNDEPPEDDEDVGDPRDWYKPVFPVALEVVPNELWETMEWGPELGRITRQVRGSDELGAKMPENEIHGGLWDMWWGMGPSPRSVRRRAIMRGLIQE